MLIADYTGFVKKGIKSASVQRQCSDAAGRGENCQVGVFVAYASPTARALIDAELYLPRSWTGDRARCAEAGVPADTQFATKPELARVMLGRALEGGVPARWATADEAYGQDHKFRVFLDGAAWAMWSRCRAARRPARVASGPSILPNATGE